MIKYFIEREDGQWLTDPDSPGPSFTTDPFKAWMFDCDEPFRTMDIPFGVSSRCTTDPGVSYGFFIIDLRDSWGKVVDFLSQETGIRYRASKQEFMEQNGQVYAHMSKTHDQGFMNILMTGTDSLKITPGTFI
jgi:hypothetical protein